MKLGLAVEYAGKGVDVPIDLIKRCEAMGYDSVWTAEAYGSDAITPLAFIAAHTKKIRLGTGVIQLSARTPAMTAMQLGTVDALAGGGRVIGGLGVSGPQIVEGWYGMPWGNPKEKMRDYVTIMKKIFAREGPVSHDGKEIQLPYQGRQNRRGRVAVPGRPRQICRGPRAAPSNSRIATRAAASSCRPGRSEARPAPPSRSSLGGTR